MERRGHLGMFIQNLKKSVCIFAFLIMVLSMFSCDTRRIFEKSEIDELIDLANNNLQAFNISENEYMASISSNDNSSKTQIKKLDGKLEYLETTLEYTSRYDNGKIITTYNSSEETSREVLENEILEEELIYAKELTLEVLSSDLEFYGYVYTFGHIYHLATKKAETYSDKIYNLILNVDYDSKNESFEYEIQYEEENKSFIFFFSAKLSMETRIFFSENFEETVDGSVSSK